jgi:hypothetical protein
VWGNGAAYRVRAKPARLLVTQTEHSLQQISSVLGVNNNYDVKSHGRNLDHGRAYVGYCVHRYIFQPNKEVGDPSLDVD